MFRIRHGHILRDCPPENFDSESEDKVDYDYESPIEHGDEYQDEYQDRGPLSQNSMVRQWPKDKPVPTHHFLTPLALSFHKFSFIDIHYENTKNKVTFIELR
jgi:hypothetical protein